MYIGRDPTTGAQTGGVSDSQSKSYGRSNSYSGEDNPRSYPRPTPTTGPFTGGQTIVLSQRRLTPYENTVDDDLSDGDDVGGGTIILMVSVMSVRVHCGECERVVVSVSVSCVGVKTIFIHILSPHPCSIQSFKSGVIVM